MVGFGMIGRTHLAAMEVNRVLHEGSCNPYPRGVCTRRPEAMAGLPFERVYGDPRELVSDPLVEVVDICTPNYLHGSAARTALEAGKSLYVEKPLSHDPAEAEALARLAEEKALPNQCALTLRFRPAVNRMKDLLEAGAIGKAVHFRACYFHHSYLDPARPMSWRQELDKSGGGSVMDLGIHLLDMLRYLLGDADRVLALARTLHRIRYLEGKSRPNNTDEYLCAMVEMKNGSAGLVETSRISDSPVHNEGFEIFGAGGSLSLDFDRGRVFLNRAGGGGPLLVEGGPGPLEQALLPLLPPVRQSLGPFVDAHAAALKNMAAWHAGERPFPGTPTFAEAVRAQALVHACLRSAENGRWEQP